MMPVEPSRQYSYSIPNDSSTRPSFPMPSVSDHSGKVRTLSADSALKADQGNNTAEERKLAQEDGKWWAEAAGYEQLHNGTTFGEGTIIGVLKFTDDLVGVHAIGGNQYWISRYENPEAFDQAWKARDEFLYKHSLSSGITFEESIFLAGGYKRVPEGFSYDESWNLSPNDISPHELVGSFQMGEWAGFTLEHDNGDRELYFMHKDQLPEFWNYVVKADDLIREGKDLRTEFPTADGSQSPGAHDGGR